LLATYSGETLGECPGGNILDPCKVWKSGLSAGESIPANEFFEMSKGNRTRGHRYKL